MISNIVKNRSLCYCCPRPARRGPCRGGPAMLTELRIRNLAIIDELVISFGPGLNVLTGETGAGKSIIVDALNLVTGGRADAHVVRSGARAAVVEATFEKVSRAAIATAEALGAETEEGAILLRRETTAEGKSRAFVGGGGVPL